jgi:hypothetical protein
LPIEASTSFGESASPVASFGFSRKSATGGDVRLDHLAEVHAVDVVGTDDDDDVGLLVAQQVEALQDGVGRTAEPALAETLLRRHGCDVRVEQPGEAPGLRDVAVETVRLVLREHHDLGEARVDEVAEREVDEAVAAPEGHGGLSPVRGERHEPLALSTCENNSKDLLRCHGYRVCERARLY